MSSTECAGCPTVPQAFPRRVHPNRASGKSESAARAANRPTREPLLHDQNNRNRLCESSAGGRDVHRVRPGRSTRNGGLRIIAAAPGLKRNQSEDGNHKKSDGDPAPTGRAALYSKAEEGQP